MDTNTTGCNQLFSDFKRDTPMYKYMRAVSEVLMLAVIVVLVYATCILFEWDKTSDVLKKALTAVDTLRTLNNCGIVGGIFWCLSSMCHPYDYTSIMCSNWIKKNNVDYKKYFGDSGAKMTGKEHRVLLAAYMSAFPQVQKADIVRIAIGIGIKVIGVILATIGFVRIVAGHFKLIKFNIMWLVLIVGGAALGLALDIIYSADPDKQKRIEWKDQIIKEANEQEIKENSEK